MPIWWICAVASGYCSLARVITPFVILKSPANYLSVGKSFLASHRFSLMVHNVAARKIFSILDVWSYCLVCDCVIKLSLAGSLNKMNKAKK